MSNPQISDEEIERMIAARRKPAIAMLSTVYPNQSFTPGCWFGGRPTLPPEIEWPVCEIPELDIAMPLQFVLQLNLDYVPHILGQPSLPRTGTLFVFFESVLAPNTLVAWGDAERPMLNGQAARVIYVDHDASNCALRSPPPIPDYSHLVSEFTVELEVKPGGQYEFDQKQFNLVIIDRYTEACSSSYVGTGRRDPFHSAHRRIREIDDELRQGLTDWRLEDEGTIEDDDDPTMVDTIYGSWGSPGFPDAEFFARRGESNPQPLEKDDIMLFRFETLKLREPITFWIKPDNLRDRSFSQIFVWEEY